MAKRNFIIVYLSVLLVSACGSLPTSGPSGKKVVALDEQQATVAMPEVEVIDLDEGVVRTLYQQKSNQSFAQFGEGRASVGAVYVGDVLDITI